MRIKIKVFPQAGKEEIIKKTDESFEVWVKAKPVQGQANRAVLRALAEYFAVSSDTIRQIKGFRERNKVFEIKKGSSL